LIHEVLSASVDRAERASLHAQLARAFEDQFESNRQQTASRLAAHYLAAADAGVGAPDAVSHCVRAAEVATSGFAFEEAVAHYRDALRLAGQSERSDEERCEILVSLGQAENRAGDVAAGSSTLRQAAELARGLGSESLLKRVTLGLHGSTRAGAPEFSVPGFQGRPAVAVLPFRDLTGAREQAHVVDGLVEELIGQLSLTRYFPVIARSSTAAYQDGAIEPRRVGRELGARYLVGGAVRRSGDRIRVNAELVDATTERQVWSGQYDRRLEELFALQEEITRALVSSMAPELTRFELRRHEPKDRSLYDVLQRAFGLASSSRWDDVEQAVVQYERGIELDPEWGKAHPALSYALIQSVHFSEADSDRSDRIARALAEARKGAELGDEMGWVTLGRSYHAAGQLEQMSEAYESALQINPSLTWAHFGYGIGLADFCRSDEAISVLERGIRLSPRDPLMAAACHGTAMAHLGAGRYAQSADWSRRSISQTTRPFAFNFALLACAYARDGRQAEAEAALAELLAREPGFSLDDLARAGPRTPEFLDRFAEGLRTAGWKG